MKAKKKRERNTDAVHVHELYLTEVKGSCLSDDSPVFEFLKASDMVHQMTALKKVTGGFKKGDFPPDSFKPVTAVLVNAYLYAPIKNQLKRALASCLQTVSSHHDNTVQSLLEEQVLAMMSDLPDQRTVVDNLAALMENFPAGEKSVICQWFNISSFLSTSLAHFYSQIGSCSGPMQVTATMHDCLSTVQVLNKVLQKSAPLVSTPPSERRTVTDEQKHTLLTGICTYVWQILADDHFLMDCRGACGMVLPLLLKIFAPSTLINEITGCILPSKGRVSMETDMCPWLSRSIPAHTLPILSRLCLVSGTLAMLDVNDLVHEYKPNTLLLTHHIAPILLDLSHRQSDTNTKLMASRTLVMWTQKARSSLDNQSPVTSPLLRGCLHGDAEIPQKLLQYTWTHWEDPIDKVYAQLSSLIIRYQARIIFENLLKCHLLATGEDAKNSEFISGLVSSLLCMGADVKGKYGPLSCLVDHIGASTLLYTSPTLPQDLLAVLGEQTLAAYVSELFEKLFTNHRQELSNAGDETYASWYTTWLDPVLTVLCSGSKQQKIQVIEYTVPKLLKCCPSSITYVTTKLAQTSTGGEGLGAVVTCLKRAKMMGILKQFHISSDDNLWHGVVPTKVVKQALCHHDNQVRLDAFGLLCENHKTTEVISCDDLDLVRYFLPLNLCSQEPSFRQQLVSLVKKLLIRLKEGSQALVRLAQSDREQPGRQAAADLERYREFLVWLTDQLFGCLHPGASFPSRTTALSLLVTVTQILGTENHSDKSPEFYLVDVLSPAHIQTLIECFTDTFEQNKSEAFTILKSLPPEYIQLQDVERLKILFEAGLELSSSTKPQDCTTAAYLLKLLLRQPGLLGIITRRGEKPSVNQPCEQVAGHTQGSTGSEESENCARTDQLNTVMLRSLKVLQLLLSGLEEQLDVARRSLLHAAATRPLYPTLHCIRYILEDTDLSTLSRNMEWRRVLSHLIELCYQVAQVVSPVVSNSSPEGNIPVDAMPEGILGPGLEVGALVPETERHLLESAHTVSLMPEYLVVCCWRSIKEVSLTLGQLTITAPLINPEGDLEDGLLSVKQLGGIGDYFTVQLLESRHRGAFELAYAGFVKMTSMLWRCPIVGVHQLPSQWLDQILADIKSGDPYSKLCSTRRSAGVPFYVQALVSTEPSVGGRVHFKHLMTELLTLAQPANSSPTQENTAQVHSLNILRALYRDNRLGEDVFPYLAEGMKAAILGYSSQLWAIRNSSSLLFSALMVRIFGVKRSRDEMSRKNCMTGRVFFHRFPALFQFLLSRLEEATEDVGSSGRYQLHPGLYPVLMVLGRLYPSVVEGADANVNIAAFIPHIIKCASSPVYKTRLMAARALQPIVGKDHIVSTLTILVAKLPRQPNQQVSHNLIHGTLLQVCHLLAEVEALPVTVRPLVEETVIKAVSDSIWLGMSQNLCYVTRQAFLEVAFHVCNIPWKIEDSNRSAQLHRLTQTVIGDTHTELVSIHHDVKLPGVIEYIQVLHRNYLQWLERNCGNRDYVKSLIPDSLEQTLCDLLSSKLYEIKTQTLELLFSAVSVSEPAQKHDGHATIARVIVESSLVIRHLVAMVMEPNTHPDCLCLTGRRCPTQTQIHFPVLPSSGFMCLFQSSLVLSGIQGHRWMRDQIYSTSQVLQRLLQLQEHLRDDVRCASFQLTAAVLPSHIYEVKQSGQEGTLLMRWLSRLEAGCSTQCSIEARLASAQAIVRNARELLLDSQLVLGDEVVRVWTVLVRLLQDEDPEVRQVAARVLQSLHSQVPSEFSDVCLEGADVQPELALNICLAVMVNQLRGHHWSTCVHTLLSWIQQDLEPDWPQQDSEVRLFDKGEMNTYQDSTNFIVLVASQLARLLAGKTSDNTSHDRNTVSSQNDISGNPAETSTRDVIDNTPEKELSRVTGSTHDPNAPLGDASMNCLSVKQRDSQNQLLLHTVQSLQEMLKSQSPISAKCPLVQTWAYNDLFISLYRSWTAIWCLLAGSPVSALEGASVESLQHRALEILGSGSALCNFTIDKALKLSL